MIDTHWLQSPRMVEVSYNDTTDALFMLYDLKKALSDKIKSQTMNESDYTIGEALDQLFDFIQDLDHKCTEVTA